MIRFVAPIQGDEVWNAELRFGQFVALTNTCRTGVRRSKRSQFGIRFGYFKMMSPQNIIRLSRP